MERERERKKERKDSPVMSQPGDLETVHAFSMLRAAFQMSRYVLTSVEAVL